MVQKLVIRKATKARKKARVWLVGPSGSGKTLTGLILAASMGGRTAVVDTEAGTSNMYEGHELLPDGFEFDVVEINDNYNPTVYAEAIKMLEKEGYENIVIDSLSHAWNGTGGVLETVTSATKKYGGNSHYAWADGTPLQNLLMAKIIQSPANIFATARSKQVYAEHVNNGRTSYVKTGTKAIQRDETDYEFDVVMRLDIEHNATIEKSRIGMDGETIPTPGAEFGERLKTIMSDGSAELGEVISEVKVYEKTKEGLVLFAKETYKMKPADVGIALANAKLTFSVDIWEKMTEAVAAGAEALAKA